jgi:hypothetical protein
MGINVFSSVNHKVRESRKGSRASCVSLISESRRSTLHVQVSSLRRLMSQESGGRTSYAHLEVVLVVIPTEA